jgi:hypothetical protein
MILTGMLCLAATRGNGIIDSIHGPLRMCRSASIFALASYEAKVGNFAQRWGPYARVSEPLDWRVFLAKARMSLHISI